MPVHDKDYWENFERSLFLTGKITQEAAYALSPRIKELRAASGDPITLYIDSPGGSSAVAEGIRFLIKAPDQDGRKCRLITVRSEERRVGKGVMFGRRGEMYVAGQD